MSRSFQAADMVLLPRLSVSDAIALGTELATWARAKKKLPGLIATSLRRVRTELEQLREADRSSTVTTGAGTGGTREADRVLDAAWAATFSWCAGWVRLPHPSELVAMATEIRDAVFSDGVRFTQLRFKVQWAESQKRLDLIAEHDLDRHFERLGGAVFLDAIRRAHERYGEVLGITRVGVPEEPASRRQRLDAFLDAVRRYVVQVSAHGDSGLPGAAELAEHLLMPLTTWESRATPPASEPAEPGQDHEGEPQPDTRAASPDELTE